MMSKRQNVSISKIIVNVAKKCGVTVIFAHALITVTKSPISRN